MQLLSRYVPVQISVRSSRKQLVLVIILCNSIYLLDQSIPLNRTDLACAVVVDVCACRKLGVDSKQPLHNLRERWPRLRFAVEAALSKTRDRKGKMWRKLPKHSVPLVDTLHKGEWGAAVQHLKQQRVSVLPF